MPLPQHRTQVRLTSPPPPSPPLQPVLSRPGRCLLPACTPPPPRQQQHQQQQQQPNSQLSASRRRVVSSVSVIVSPVSLRVCVSPVSSSPRPASPHSASQQPSDKIKKSIRSNTTPKPAATRPPGNSALQLQLQPAANSTTPGRRSPETNTTGSVRARTTTTPSSAQRPERGGTRGGRRTPSKMKMTLLLLALAAGCVSAQTTTTPVPEPVTPVNVTVYYESLCPDSIRFYVNQLYPTMNSSLATSVALDLVPYGKSTYTRQSNNSVTFECHHGERECYGNKVHACALTHLTSQKERLAYLECLLRTMLNDRQAVFPADKCAAEIQIRDQEKASIINCANSTESDNLLAEMGDKTNRLEPKLSSVPTVVFNDKYDQGDFKLAQTNFKGLLCKYLSYKPSECAGTSGSGVFSKSLTLLIAPFIILSLLA